MLLLQQMIVLFIMMIIGYCLGRRGRFDDELSDKLSWLVVNIANPGLILSSGISSDGSIRGSSLALAFLVAGVMFLILIPVGYLVEKILRVKEDERGVYPLLTVFSNMGFMGFPLISLMYGSGGLLYGTPFLLVFSVLLYTWGITEIQQGGSGKKEFSIKKIFNPGVIASILAITIYLLGIEMPLFVENTVDMLKELTAPLSMMIVGYSFCSISLKELFTDVRLLVFSALKLIVIPVIGVFIIGRFIDNEMLLAVSAVVLATPAGSMNAILTQQYGGNHRLAAKGVAITTLLSVVTIPAVFAIMGL